MERLFFDAVTTLFVYTFSKEDVIGERCDKIVAKIKEQLEVLRGLGARHKALTPKFTGVEKAAQKSITLIVEAKESVDEGGRKLGGMRGLEKRQRVQECSQEIIHELSEYVEAAVRLEKYEPQKVVAIRKQITALLVIGLAFSIIMAVYIALFFSRDISRRVLTVRDNATRFEQGQELIPPIGGHDEIKELDKVFRSMADNLNRAQAEQKRIEELKQQFVAMLSHDLRSPLTALQFFLSSLDEELQAKGISVESQNRLKSSQNNLIRLIGLINDLLDLDKLNEGKMELLKKNFFLNDTIIDCVQMVSALSEAKNLSIDIGETDIELCADEEKIVRLITNLLSNAIKFSPAGKTIKLWIHEKDSFVEVHIVDEGPGISDAEKNMIFERFYQTAEGEAAHGSGLGLSICRAIVEAHGGKIGLNSKIGQGADFWFCLPLD